MFSVIRALQPAKTERSHSMTSAGISFTAIASLTGSPGELASEAESLSAGVAA